MALEFFRHFLLTRSVPKSQPFFFLFLFFWGNFSLHVSLFFTGYVQGMNDIASPLLLVLRDEATTFWCFVEAMKLVVSRCDYVLQIFGVKKKLMAEGSVYLSGYWNQLCVYTPVSHF